MAVGLMADATLKGTLGLSVDQARVVDGIQARYRPPFAAKRQEQNQELRKLRRARIANDSKLMAELEVVTERLHAQLRQIQLNEDEEIRRVLTAEQRVKFEEYLKLRKAMVGSSRDAKDY
jgi:Spy/CpxP family protein refolding chaperone